MTNRNERPERTPDPPDDGPRKRGRPRRTEPGIEQYQAIELHFAGKTNIEIAERLGVSGRSTADTGGMRKITKTPGFSATSAAPPRGPPTVPHGPTTPVNARRETTR
jgi:hypothetical protein